LFGRTRQDHQDQLQQSVQWREEAEHHEGKLHNLYDEHRHLSGMAREHQEELQKRVHLESERLDQEAEAKRRQRGARLARHTFCYTPAMLDIQLCHRAKKVKKINLNSAGNKIKHPTFGWRWLKLCLQEEGAGKPSLRLMWASARADDREPPRPGERGAPAYSLKSSCDLAHIQVVAHGHAARAPPLLDYSQGAPVECCFSIFTRTRSFDFVCEEEGDCEAFVVLLSRLCHRIQGWPVLGNIATPAKFQAAKGWCKVQAANRKARTPMVHAVKQALERVSADRDSGLL